MRILAPALLLGFLLLAAPAQALEIRLFPGDVAEGNAAYFVVLFDEGDPGVVRVVPEAGTATAGDDFVARTVEVSRGGRGQGWIETVTDWSEDEGDETFTLRAEGTDATATVTIDDFDAQRGGAQVVPPYFTPNESAGRLKFEIQVSSPERGGTAEWRTVDMRGLAGRDYVASSGRFTFPAGQSVHQAEVGLVDDNVNEREHRDFFVLVESPELHDASSWLDAADDDRIRIAVAPATVLEGGGPARVPLRLSVRSIHTITSPLTLDPYGNGGVPDVDAVLRGTRVTYAPGEMEAFTEVEAVDDELVEGPESLLLHHPYGIQTEQVDGNLVQIADDDTADVATAGDHPLLALGHPTLRDARTVAIGTRCLAKVACSGRLTFSARGRANRRALNLAAGRSRTLRFRLARPTRRIRVRAAAVVRDASGRSGRATTSARLRR